MEHGHGGYTNHGCRCDTCSTAAREYQKAYQRSHRERTQAQRSAYSIRYYEAHREELIAKSHSPQYRLLRRSRQKNREARKLNQFIEDVDHKTVYQMHGGCCGICKRFVAEDNFHVDHVIPISRGGQHGYVNVQPAHPTCNLRKGNRLAASASHPSAVADPSGSPSTV